MRLDGSSMSEISPLFSQAVIAWQATRGRHHLPWQQTRDPYRVWLSEIMLQQTQVSIVLTYYTRFLEAFPSVSALAQASQDDVMALWSGLGYYSRARNLHRCAQMVVELHGGEFPPSAEALAELPGIGRSTAGAIAAFCFSERTPILDANVRRVLTRYLGFDADLAQAANERKLWDLAHALLPADDGNLDHAMPRYTQALMDLGAMVCTPRTPACAECPVHTRCQAHRERAPEKYPVKTRKLRRQSQAWWLLMGRNAKGELWLERRPNQGVWAGLHCFPVFADENALHQWALERKVGATSEAEMLSPLKHVLTHMDLHLHPVLCSWDADARALSDGVWVHPDQVADWGVPKPVRTLMEQLRDSLF